MFKNAEQKHLPCHVRRCSCRRRRVPGLAPFIAQTSLHFAPLRQTDTSPGKRACVTYNLWIQRVQTDFGNAAKYDVTVKNVTGSLATAIASSLDAAGLDTEVVCFLWWSAGAWAYPGLNRTRRTTHCNADLEYRHGDVCCQNCPAGTHLKSPCSKPSGRSECEECDLGTFTELGNGLKKCLSCSLCRPDQVVVHHCVSTHNTECECKPGGFCAPDQACEVCKRCARCGKDEIVVRNCTSTSNTECKKKPPDSGQASDQTAANITIGLLVPLAAVFVILMVAFLYRRKHKSTEKGSGAKKVTETTKSSYTAKKPYGCNGAEKSLEQSPRCWTLVRPKSLPVVDLEEQRSLCEGSGSTSNSQDNLITSLPLFTCTAPAASSCAPAASSSALTTRVDEPQFNIVPVNGQASLRRSFDFFEEMDVYYHSRFFRRLGLSDNVIKSRDSLTYVDRVHELLNLWLEKRGREAALKDLLSALMDLNQRRTAETIVERAVEAGYFVHE
ncbi:hypothetical protein WMY93_020432 [Mugilogobius chulae]|uniref:Uncharacterized protein n=1 Tax=Mugilogobius chulae TaxID=88201 RepID=A0AAW0NLC6_9GOBI